MCGRGQGEAVREVCVFKIKVWVVEIGSGQGERDWKTRNCDFCSRWVTQQQQHVDAATAAGAVRRCMEIPYTFFQTHSLNPYLASETRSTPQVPRDQPSSNHTTRCVCRHKLDTAVELGDGHPALQTNTPGIRTPIPAGVGRVVPGPARVEVLRPGVLVCKAGCPSPTPTSFLLTSCASAKNSHT